MFLQVWLHCLLAVFGMRRLAGALGVGRWQTYFMAFIFVASGALTARWAAGQLPNCWAICYVPWLLYCAVRTAEPWQARRVALYSVLLALQMLCHPQVFWFSAIGQAVFIVIQAVRLPLREALHDVGRGLWQFGVACVWCAGLLAVVLMPFLELVAQSNRSESSPAFANAFNLPWRGLCYLFVPQWPGGIVWETNLFVGTLAVVLGLAGLCRLRERNVRGLLGMLAIGLLIALGDNTPCFGLFYKWLPGHAGFRFHSRAALLVVVALICAAGIWLSRPHPRLRAVWTYLFGVPVRYALVLVVLLQSLALLQGNWIIKRVTTRGCCLAVGTPFEDSFEQTLVREMRKADLIKPLLPPPRVSVPPLVVPASHGMIHHYSHFDAGCALSLRRPWDYLHAVLGLTPNPGKGELPFEVYLSGPLPYADLNLSAGLSPRSLELVLATNPAPRAFLVYGAEVVGNYDAILKRLASRHDIHESALLEGPLPEPLPQASALPGTEAAIRRFEPNSLLVEVDAKTNALLVLAEAWYPGWRAEIDGRADACVPANIWMRAVPVPAGRHQVRFYFRQNYLPQGLLISLVSVALVLVAVAKRRRRTLLPRHEPDASDLRPAPRPGGKRSVKKGPGPPSRKPDALSTYRPLLRALAAGGVLVVVWLVARTEIWQVRRFQAMSSEVESAANSQLARRLTRQHQTAQAVVHYTKAVRLAERTCELTGYRDPTLLATLAFAYADAGRFDAALATARTGRSLALASGHNEMAEKLLKFIETCTARQSRQEGNRN